MYCFNKSKKKQMYLQQEVLDIITAELNYQLMRVVENEV